MVILKETLKEINEKLEKMDNVEQIWITYPPSGNKTGNLRIYTYDKENNRSWFSVNNNPK